MKIRIKGKKESEKGIAYKEIVFLPFLILFSLVFIPSLGLGLEINIINSSLNSSVNISDREPTDLYYIINESDILNIELNVSNSNGNVTFSVNSTDANISTSNTTANLNFTLEEFCEIGTDEKNYTIKVIAKDSTNSPAYKDINITVLRVNEEPIINNTYINDDPYENDVEVISDEITIRLSTNSSYECRYDYSNKSFEEMKYEFEFQSTSNTEYEYEAIFKNLEQKSYSIFIRCIDECGNYMEEPEEIKFVNLPPSAMISLYPKPPLKEGMVNVELSASEPLASAPELTYTFDNDRTPKPVYLEGEGKYWKGYLVIREENVEKIGSFSFKGYDTTGIEGTEIKDGKIFLVDTIPPERIESLRIENQQDRIRLVWSYHTDNDIEEYKIYRRKGSGGTDVIDYYDKTDETYYYDKDVEFNEAYYYRISAVDKAGNEGELSKEIFITFRPEKLEEPEKSDEDEKEEIAKEEEKLKPTLMTELENMLSEIDTFLLDIRGKIEEFKRTKDKDKITVIENLMILEELKGTEQRLSTLRNEMAKLENQSLSDSEFDSITKNSIEEAREEWENSIKYISIEDSEKYEEDIDDEKTTLVFKEYLAEEDIEADEKIIKEVAIAQDSITIETQIFDVILNTFGNQSKNYLLVKKDISSSQKISEAIILEWIPVELKGKIQEVELLVQGEEVIKNNLYRWNKKGLTSFSLAYIIKGDIRPVDLKDSKAIIFNNELLKNISNANGNQITGAHSTDVEKNEELHPLFIPTITAIIIAAFLLLYYLIVVKKENSIGKIKREEREESDKRLKINDSKEEEIREDEKIPTTKEETSKDVKDIILQRGDIKMKKEDEHPMIIIYSYLENFKENLENKDEIGLNESEIIKENAKKIQLLCKEIIAINTEKHAETTKRYILKALKQIEENKEYKPKEENNATKHKIGLEKRKLLVKKGIEKKNKEENAKNGTKKDNNFEEKNKENKKDRIMIAPEGKEFRLANGELIRSTKELAEKLEKMKDETFSHHIREINGETRNDFAIWLRDVFGFEDDFPNMNKIKDRVEFLEKIKEIL